MAKQRTMNLEQPSLLEQEIVKIVDDAIRNSKIELTAEDVKIIAQEVMPDLDRLIATKVSQHFYEIGKFLVDKFTMGE